MRPRRRKRRRTMPAEAKSATTTTTTSVATKRGPRSQAIGRWLVDSSAPLSLLLLLLLLLVAGPPPGRVEAAEQERESGTRTPHELEQQQLVSRSAPSEARAVNRRPRLYRIRAAAANGRLSLGAPLEQFGARTSSAPSKSAASVACQQQIASSAEQRQLGSSIAASSQTLRLLGPSAKQQPAGELQESEQTVARSSARLRLTPPPGDELEGQPRRALELSGEPADQQQPASSILSLIDDFDSKISTNRTKAQLSCDSGEMILRLNFSEPFRGIVYPDQNRLSPCRFFGDGHHNYELRLPLKGCGTRQIAQRVFVNDVVVRFHKSLELEEDEVKTLICRYPAPLAPASSGNGLVHELEPSAPASGYNSGGLNDVAQPFEFVDPVSGRIVSSRESHESGRAGRPPQRPNANIIRLASLDTPPQRAATPPDGSPSPSSPSPLFPLAPTATANSAGLLDGLSSVELLLLISSLMFLVLLALGLAAGYLCLSSSRRRRERTRQHQRQLYKSHRHQHRPFVVPKSLGGAPPAGPASSLYNWPVSYEQQQQQLTGAGGGQQAAQVQQQTVRCAAPSLSPADDATSDMSARVLLPPQQNPSSLGRRQHRQLIEEMRRQQQQQRPQVLGRRETNTHQHYQASLGRRRQQPQQQQQYFNEAFDELELDSDNTESSPQGRRGQQLRAHSMQALAGGQPPQPLRVRQWSQAANGSLEPGGPSLLARQARHDYQADASPPVPHKPRLLLQSIDDTFITKVTEVHEQEWMKRDEMDKPLGWPQWAAASARASRRRRRDRDGEHEPSSIESADNERRQTDDEGQRHKSKLRSLTELDVNFAKSLRRTLPKASEAEAEVAKRPAGATSGAQQQAALSSESADLVISPEYDCPTESLQQQQQQQQEAGSKRLEAPPPPHGLRLNTGRSPSADSHESISYV